MGDWDEEDEEEDDDDDDDDMESGAVDNAFTSGQDDGAGTLGIARIVCGGAFIARWT